MNLLNTPHSVSAPASAPMAAGSALAMPQRNRSRRPVVFQAIVSGLWRVASLASTGVFWLIAAGVVALCLSLDGEHREHQ